MRTSITHIVVPFALLCACASTARSPIIVPPESVREWAYTPEGAATSDRYVIRMSDGTQEWEVEFPNNVTGSEVRVPLKNAGRISSHGDRPGLTAADREIEADKQAARQREFDSRDPMYSLIDENAPRTAAPREGRGRSDAADSAAEGKAPKRPAAPKASYLLGVNEVRELVKSRNYEVALVKLVNLEKEYPNDEKLLAMKGTIYRQLGRSKLAREAWERVLALNPDNTVVAGALRELAEEEERAKRSADERDRDRQGEGDD